ncbi:RNA pyrophosphohydrolase [Afifella sp. IM 167]|uniref:RNA pyrophosphohydrolase n=1 Tax=Afifella sp. IM 167 TaxID=2033586 RepID=UPI001CCE5A52|nr:RNA pyrophosphohydrolase [Afifella sp. IM 167]MBZ8131935.1 RNA pyrophosphohydrolase [Afifella sp. IM 167]
MDQQNGVGQPLDGYRPCVGLVVFNPDGFVFLGRRKGGEESVAQGFAWQMPQGGMDEGENAQEAAVRELWEETGMRTVTLLAEAPLWWSYDLPEELCRSAWKGRYRGQTQKWFAFRFEGDESEIDIGPRDGHPQEFTEWRWERLDRTPDLVIPFKRDVYRQVVATFDRFAAL